MNFLGRCNECDFALFATVEDVRQGENFRDVKAGTAVRVGNNGVFGRCQSGHKFFPMHAVRGTYSAVHKCDSRCLNAKGHSCTCSCGGANHGRGHAGAIVQASEPQRSEHIGEVGKHIRGTATVQRSVEVESDYGTSVLYVFATDKGAIIKWFAPSYADPKFDLGQSVTFRAKVKRHDTYQDEAQTIVTYFEEIEP